MAVTRNFLWRRDRQTDKPTILYCLSDSKKAQKAGVLLNNNDWQWRRQTRGVGCIRAPPVTKRHNIFEARFCIRHECNGRYWYSNSVRPFVCPGHSGIVSKQLNVGLGLYRLEIVEIISPPDSPVILAFGQSLLRNSDVGRPYCVKCWSGIARF